MRARAFSCSNLQLDDELDHIGMYFKHNDYAKYANEFTNADKIVFGGYRDDIDKFYYDKRLDAGATFSARQDLPNVFAQIIEVMSVNPKAGARFVASSLLNFDSESREGIVSKIQGALRRQLREGRLLPVSVLGIIPITFVVSLISEFECKKSEAKEAVLGSLFTSSDKYRILIEVAFCDLEEVFEVDYSIFHSDNLTEEEIEIGKAYSERLKKSRKTKFQSEVGLPSRNAKCPCGSGKKYKKCCLDR